VDQLLDAHKGEIAAVIVEPVSGNMGLVPPASGFLEGLRTVTKANGALLIFDEVMTGFRVHRGGAQTLYGIEPDLTALGKVIGGGLPVGAYGGRRDIMEMVAPVGPVYQAGTLSGNPLAMTAGIETLQELEKPDLWDRMDAAGERLINGLSAAAEESRIPVVLNRVGTMIGMFFNDGPVTDWESVSRSNVERFNSYFRSMLERGVYIAPSPFEAGFLSAAHDDGVIETTIEVAARAFAAL
jgi:glutamate-1-semialdehyde 2,1-aminomutase